MPLEIPPGLVQMAASLSNAQTSHRSRAARPPEAPYVEPIVDFSWGPEEKPGDDYKKCSFWDLLHGWAVRHGVDDDLALLTCACACAHVAGPKLDLDKTKPPGRCRSIPAPTLIAPREDQGFFLAVKASVKSLYSIQQDLLTQHGKVEMPPEPVPKKRRRLTPEERRENLSRQFLKQYPAFRHSGPDPQGRDINPDKQERGYVRFLSEGPTPDNPVEYLRKCHFYTALSVGVAETIPQLYRARERRLNRLASVVSGCGYRDKVSLRGFLRFCRKDLEWLTENKKALLFNTLPVESPGGDSQDALPAETAEVREFSRLHRSALRRVLELRFLRKECDVDFSNGDVGGRFRQSRDCYQKLVGPLSSVCKTTQILPDLFVWYFLQLGKSAWLTIDEEEIAEHAIAAARRISRRVAGYYDQHSAVKHARKRLALANKVVARMRQLPLPCKRREIARGLDNQRMEIVAPMIDELVDLGVISNSDGWLRFMPIKDGRSLTEDDFMHPQPEPLFSFIRRLDAAEERYAHEAQTLITQPQDQTDP